MRQPVIGGGFISRQVEDLEFLEAGDSGEVDRRKTRLIARHVENAKAREKRDVLGVCLCAGENQFLEVLQFAERGEATGGDLGPPQIKGAEPCKLSELADAFVGEFAGQA